MVGVDGLLQVDGSVIADRVEVELDEAPEADPEPEV